MPFVPKKTKKKVEARYKTIYLRQTLIDALENIAKENDTSFNNRGGKHDRALSGGRGNRRK